MKPFKDRPRPAPKAPGVIACPKCGAEVDTEVLRGRVRWVTATITHVKPGTRTQVCVAVLKEEEHRDRTA